MLPNAAALTWIGEGRILFSEIKSGMHMGIVTATESRAESRDVYLPRMSAPWLIIPIFPPIESGC